jgi:hypothetical protein
LRVGAARIAEQDRCADFLSREGAADRWFAGVGRIMALVRLADFSTAVLVLFFDFEH